MPSLPGLSLYGEFAYEENGGRAQAFGYALQAGYRVDEWWGKPSFAYRYAYFSGDDPDTENKNEAFDPLAYGGSDWGTWFQGEIIGHYVLLNTNLKTHLVRFDLHPFDNVHRRPSVLQVRARQRPELRRHRVVVRPGTRPHRHLVHRQALPHHRRRRRRPPQQAAKQLTGGTKDWFIGKLFLNFEL